MKFRPLPAIFWPMSENKTASIRCPEPRVGRLALHFEIFPAIVIAFSHPSAAAASGSAMEL